MNELPDAPGPPSTPAGLEVRVRRAGFNIIGDAIRSGHVEDAFEDLIKLDDTVSRYQTAADAHIVESVRSGHSDPKAIERLEKAKDFLDGATQAARVLARRCLDEMADTERHRSSGKKSTGKGTTDEP